MIVDKENSITIASEEEYIENTVQYIEQAKTYFEQIDEWIRSRSADGLRNIATFYTESDNAPYIGALDKLSQLSIFAGILIEEIQKRKEQLFAMNFQSAEQFLSFWTGLKFLSWRLEFDTEPDAAEQFFEYATQWQVSPTVLYYMIKTVSMGAKGMYSKLLDLYIEKKKYEFVKELAMYGLQEFPEEQVLREVIAAFS